MLLHQLHQGDVIGQVLPHRGHQLLSCKIFQRGSAAAVPASELLRRHPVRISATIPWGLHQRLQDQADLDGRSLSNLIAFLLEAASHHG